MSRSHWALCLWVRPAVSVNEACIVRRCNERAATATTHRVGAGILDNRRLQLEEIERFSVVASVLARHGRGEHPAAAATGSELSASGRSADASRTGSSSAAPAAPTRNPSGERGERRTWSARSARRRPSCRQAGRTTGRQHVGGRPLPISSDWIVACSRGQVFDDVGRTLRGARRQHGEKAREAIKATVDRRCCPGRPGPSNRAAWRGR